MAEIQENAAVRQVKFITDDIILLTIISPQIASLGQPGQFVMIKCSGEDDPLLRRPFSIHNALSDGSVEILFKVVGRGTRLLAGLKTGQQLNLIGPLGKGFKLKRPGAVCLVGGGLGIAPLYFLAKDVLHSQRSEDVVLLGAASAKELSGLNKRFMELGLPVFCASDDGSIGHHGFVTELLADLSPLVQTVYVCGPLPMMKIVAEYCRERELDCQVSLETHMACGLGACLGCTVHGSNGEYRHVCKHGPVFAAREVSWNQ